MHLTSTEQQTEASALQWKAILSSPGPSPSPRPCGVVQHDQGEGHQQPITFRLLGEGVRVYFFFVKAKWQQSLSTIVTHPESKGGVESRANNLCNKSSKGLTIPTVSLVYQHPSTRWSNIHRMLNSHSRSQ